ncbi:histone-fold-containing protein [Lentinula raphanica]|nr:histone-fold-containing protein [Lentinula raphanica]
MSEAISMAPAPIVAPIAPWEQADGSRIETENVNEEPAPITEQEVGEYREQDRCLPIANVSRIMKASVPSTAKIAKDAKECVQEYANFPPVRLPLEVRSNVCSRCLEKRKTIGGEDILYAMGSLGFDNYAECLKVLLAKLRAHQHGNAAMSGGSGCNTDRIDED